MRKNVALAVLVALSGTIAACSDSHPLVSRAPARLLDLAPLPPTAETVFADSIEPLPPGALPLYHVWTDFARLSFWNFSIPWDFFADGSRRQILVPNSWAPPEWQRVQIDGGKHASAVRVTAYTQTGFAMTCHTISGGAVSSRIDGPGNFVLAKGVLDVQAPGIAYCTFFGSGGIESLSYVPEREQEAKLVVECNKQTSSISLVRASEIHCIPKSDPEGSPVTVTRWEFRGTDYRYPGPDDEPVTTPEWRGPMVMSGTITVTAKVGSSRDDTTAVMNVTMTPRTTAPQQPELVSGRRVEIAEIDSLHRPHVPPRNVHDLGLIQYGPVLFGNTDPEASSFFGFVTDGPNTHLAYLTRVPAKVEFLVALNPEMRIGSDFYRRQARMGQVVTPTCVQEQWQTYINRILAHEGFPTNPNSHAGYYEKKLREQAWPAIEDIVRPDDELYKMAETWQSRLPRVFDDAKRYAERVDTEHPVGFGCNFNWNR